MANCLPLTDAAGEVRELTTEDFRHFRPAYEVLPEIVGAKLAAEMLHNTTQPMLPKDGTNAVFTNVYLDVDVLEAFRATGSDWQTKLNIALKEWITTHPQHFKHFNHD